MANRNLWKKEYRGLKGEKVKKFKKINHTIVEYLTLAVLIMLATALLQKYVIENVYIPSGSMEDTLQIGDRVFGNKLAYLFSEPERFDVVTFVPPDEPGGKYIKRIIGLPGETVTIRDGEVYINDSTEPLDDSFLKEEMEPEEEMVFEVPEGCYFMLGDNRNDSNDSRYWENSYVPREDIVAKAIIKYWRRPCLIKSITHD